MYMTQDELSRLAQKYLSGIATAEEKRLLHEWYYDPQGEWVAEIPEDPEVLEARMRVRLMRTIGTRRIPMTAWRVAAALILVAGAAALFYRTPPKTKPQAILPGSTKAILTLADGTTKTLDSGHTGWTLKQGAAKVQQATGGVLAYEATPASEIVYNTLSVPRGGQYQLKLSDGTQVWLDAASSLRYPVSFGKTERVVEVTGQAYFSVAPDASRPFRVKVVNREEVQVLGTEFNINAYDDEAFLQTTLLEGKVRVNGKDLAPGEQARLDGGGTLILSDDVDKEAVVAWKSDMFYFDNEDIGTIMRQVERWYDVTVDYEGDMTGKIFTGQISRYAQVSQVLEMLELTHDIHFRIGSGNHITVLP